MNKLILFPGYVWIDGAVWHGCRKYQHVGVMKETLPPRDWRRVYNWDLLRWLRGQRDATARRRCRMTVTQLDGAWVVLDTHGEELSRHATNADAWKWIEGQSNSDWCPAACRHDWSFRTNAQGGGDAA